MKHGKTLHGEWWFEGKRIPREGGHRETLPDGMEECPLEAPWAPQLTHTLDVLDGCAAQFAGKNNYHQDAVWGTKTGVTRSHFTHEASDGKGPSDGYNNVPRHAVAAGLRANELLDPGTRELVTYLAKRCPSPSVAKALKQGWWAAEGYIWAYSTTQRSSPRRRCQRRTATQAQWRTTATSASAKTRRQQSATVLCWHVASGAAASRASITTSATAS